MNQPAALQPPPNSIHVGTIVMGVIAVAFIGFIVYLASREKPPQASPVKSAATVANEEIDEEITPQAESHIDPSYLQSLYANNPNRVYEEEEAVRKKILEYFSLIYVDMLNTANARHHHEKRAELEEYLASLPPEMVPLLIELLASEKEPINRYILIAALGKIGSDLAADALVAHYHWAKPQHNKIKDLERAIEALGTVQSDHSYDLLTDFIAEEGESDRAHRFRFVKQLGAHARRDDAVPLFHELAADDGHPNVRNYAAQALKRTAKRESAPKLEHLLQTEQNMFVRETMIGALAAIGDPASLDTLAGIAKIDDNDSTRRSAVEAIFKIGGVGAKEILKEVVDQKDIKHTRIGAQTNTGVCPECAKVRDAARRHIVSLEEMGF